MLSDQPNFSIKPGDKNASDDESDLTVMHYVICGLPLIVMAYMAFKQSNDSQKNKDEARDLMLMLQIMVIFGILVAAICLLVYLEIIPTASLPSYSFEVSTRNRLLALLVSSVVARYWYHELGISSKEVRN